jgi:hypothetical protein
MWLTIWTIAIALAVALSVTAVAMQAEIGTPR